jgi:hypothetical protein
MTSIRAERQAGITGFLFSFMRHEDIDQAKWVITSNTTKELFVGFLTPTSFDSVAS